MINTYKYPNELVSNAEKNSFEFGKAFSEAMWNDWQTKLAKNRTEFKENRSYALGDHSIEKCKQNIRRKYIKEEFLHIDWDDKIKSLPTLLRRVYNYVDMKEFTPIVYALDPSAREEKAKEKNEKLDLFYAKDFLEKLAEQNGGYSDIPLDQIPNSKEQIELEEKTKQPLTIETAEELVLQSVSNENNFNSIQKEVLKDTVECGFGVVRIETCKIEGIKITKVEPDNFIHSATKNIFFNDCNYFGEERFITVSQMKNIARSSGISISDDDIKKMVSATENDNIDPDKTVIKVLYYTFKTFHQSVYKKKVNRKTKAISLIDRTKDIGTDKEYNPSPDYKSDVSEKISTNYDVWYEGILVLNGERKIIRHRLIENLPEFDGEIIPPYIAYAPRISKDSYNPIVGEVKTIVDSIQELRMRILHQRNKLRGNITEIDPDMIANITLGNQKLTPEEVLSFYFSLDIAFRKTIDEDGEPINGNRPLTEMPTGIPYALRELMVQFVEDLKMLNESLGNIGFDLSKPDNKTLYEGEPYRLSDNVQMKDYSDCLYTWSINVFQAISSRINDIFKWSNIKEKYINMIGTDDVEVLEKYKNRSLHYFGIFQDYVPTRQERIKLVENISQYVKQALIDPLDGEEILNIRNNKIALRLLRLKLDQRKKESNDFELQKYQQATNGNIQASIISNEEKRKTLQMEAELKQKQKILEFQLELKKIEADGLLKLQSEKERNNFKQELENMRKEFEANLTTMKKDRDEETRLKAINQSAYNNQQLIKLRKGEISDIKENPMQEINLSNTI